MRTRNSGLLFLLFSAAIISVPAEDLFQERALTTIPDSYGKLVANSAEVLADGKTYGYLVQKGANLALIHDGKEVTELDPDRQPGVWGGPGLLRNPGAGILYFGKRNGRCVLVLNDRVWETPCLDSLASHEFSPDGKHIAYWVRIDPRKQIFSAYIDGKELGPFYGVGGVTFHDDGSYELRARRGAAFPRGTEVLITSSGQETPIDSAAPGPRAEMGRPRRNSRSEGGLRITRPSNKGGKGGEPLGRFWVDDTFQTLFTPTGTTVSIKSHFEFQGAEHTVDGRIKEMVVSPDGTSVACLVEFWGQDPGEQHPHVEGYAVLHGEQMGERFPSEHHPAALGLGSDWPPMIKSIAFSPNGKSLAYVVDLGEQRSGKQIVVLNGQKTEPFDGVLSSLVFNPDGSKLAFGALAGREILWKVMTATGN